VDRHCRIYEVIGEFVALDEAITPDASGFDGATIRTADTFNARQNGNANYVFNAAIPT
jgi:hypothetical protein